MKTWEDFEKEGMALITSHGDVVHSDKYHIVLPNAWEANIINSPIDGYKYSIAICDCDGNFDWDILNTYKYSMSKKYGTILCNTDEDVARALEFISQLPYHDLYGNIC